MNLNQPLVSNIAAPDNVLELYASPESEKELELANEAQRQRKIAGDIGKSPDQLARERRREEC